MHDKSIQDRFIELRAQGFTLDHIAGELGVSRRTLAAWQKKLHDRIESLHSVQIEALQSRILASHEQELTRLATQLEQAEDVLARRKLECLSTEYLFRLAGSLRAQIRKQRLKPVFHTDPGSDLPEADSASAASTLNDQPLTDHERLPHQNGEPIEVLAQQLRQPVPALPAPDPTESTPAPNTP